MKKAVTKRVQMKDNDMRSEYDFTGGVRGKYYKAMQAGYTIMIQNTDGTTAVKDVMPLRSGVSVVESAEGRMTTKVAQMTKGELKEMIETSIEQKLLELLGDPDEGLPLRKSVRDRLLRQKQAVRAGERGEPFEDVVQRLGLK
jgi:hypothetical protein